MTFAEFKCTPPAYVLLTLMAKEQFETVTLCEVQNMWLMSLMMRDGLMEKDGDHFTSVDPDRQEAAAERHAGLINEMIGEVDITTDLSLKETGRALVDRFLK